MIRAILLPALLGALLQALPGTGRLAAQEWTRFRGPDGAGVSAAQGILERWTEADLDWKVRLPGVGHSGPVLWGEKVFLTSAEDEGRRRLVLRLRAADGGVEWTRSFPASASKVHVRSSHASSTPAVDAERVYVSLSEPSSYLLKAFDHSGKEVWSRDLGPYQSQHGDGASPILHEDLVVLANEQDGESSVAAFDRRTGEPRWKSPRRSAEVAYGTPLVYREGERAALLLSSHAHGLSSLDALTGKLLWEAPVFDKRTVSSPVLAGGLCIGTCGSGGGGNFLVAVRPGGEGDVAATRVAFKLSKAIPYVPTPLALGDLLFLWGDLGVVTCVEVPSGKVVWQERAGGNYSGSPVAAGGRIYCVSDDGEVVVLAAAREFKVLARNPLGEGSRSTPAIAGGRLYLRTYSHLIAVGGRLTPSARPAPPSPPGD